MSIRNLSPLLHPRSVAVIGGSKRPGALGTVVLANVLAAGFEGAVYVVNPKPVECEGATWAASIADLPEAPDLAAICTPSATVPDLIAQLGERGTRTAVVLSAGINDANGLRAPMLEAAHSYGLRIVGPNCVGVLSPYAHLNTTFARGMARPGGLALIAQSGALVTTMIDWAETHDVGFSAIMSSGDVADVDIGDLIDLMAQDPKTRAILIHVEGLTNAGNFLSAARAAARIKPVIAIKGGRSEAASKAAQSHTGALAGSYDVYAAAFDRAGIVMVDSLADLFDAAEIMYTARPLKGDRLAIVTNGGGAGVLALDALAMLGVEPARLAPETLSALDGCLPSGWSHGNPIDLIGDADAARYQAAIEIVARDPGVDAILAINCPTALASAADTARAAAQSLELQTKTALGCWLGGPNFAAAEPLFAAADIPLFDTPEDAVRAFGHLLAGKRTHDALAHTHAPGATDPDAGEQARAIIAATRAAGRIMLSELEAKQLLAAYGVPVVESRFATAPADVARACKGLPAPYAVKIVSPQLSHKSDVGGVALGLADAAAAAQAAKTMAERIGREHPEAVIAGFAVEPMVTKPHGYELALGIADDATFGPVVMVAAGGTAVEVLHDRALELPPFDDAVAQAMIGRTRIARLLAGYRDVPPADVSAVVRALGALSRIAADLPDVLELDINPLLVDADGAVALDARVRIAAEPVTASRLAIAAAPTDWAADLVTRTGIALHVRPALPGDAALVADLFTHVSDEDLRFRFGDTRRLTPEQIALMTEVDYRRTVGFLALEGDVPVALAMLAAHPDGERAEVAVSVRADRKDKGVSWTLMDHVLRYAAARGIRTIQSIESKDNRAAIALEREMGFVAAPCEDAWEDVLVSKPIGRA